MIAAAIISTMPVLQAKKERILWLWSTGFNKMNYLLHIIWGNVRVDDKIIWKMNWFPHHNFGLIKYPLFSQSLFIWRGHTHFAYCSLFVHSLRSHCGLSSWSLTPSLRQPVNNGNEKVLQKSKNVSLTFSSSKEVVAIEEPFLKAKF